MPTMSSYELKVTGLLKDVDDAQADAARQAFINLFPAPATAPPDSWAASFLPPSDTTLDDDARVEDESWTVMKGSKLKAGSRLAQGSKLNGVTLADETELKADTYVTDDYTIVTKHTNLKQGTLLKNEAYQTLLWRAAKENAPEWGPATAPGDVDERGKYGLLSFQALVGVVRPGALGQHWKRQTAQDELKFFYNYKKAPWFRKLLKDLIDFNHHWGNVLEEEVRIRDLKWYCGNGGGP